MNTIGSREQNNVQDYTWIVPDTVRHDSGLIRISKQLYNRTTIADMLNSWKDLLDVLPEDDFEAIDSIDIDVFDISCCASNAKRLKLFHGCVG